MSDEPQKLWQKRRDAKRMRSGLLIVVVLATCAGLVGFLCWDATLPRLPAGGQPAADAPAFQIVELDEYQRPPSDDWDRRADGRRAPLKSCLSARVETRDMDRSREIAQEVARWGAEQGYDEGTVFFHAPGDLQAGWDVAARVWEWREGEGLRCTFECEVRRPRGPGACRPADRAERRGTRGELSRDGGTKGREVGAG